MALVVEDGTAKSNAESYDSVANVTTYFTNYNRTPSGWASLTTAQQEQHLRIATQYIDAKYRGRWKGHRSNESQALAWPRHQVSDEDGYLVNFDSVPVQLRQALAEVVVLSVSGTGLLGDLSSEGTIKRSKIKVGPVEEDITYSNPSNQLPDFPRVDRLLAGFLVDSGSDSVRTAKLVRA